MVKDWKKKLVYAVLIGIPFLAIFVSLFIGRYPLRLSEILKVLSEPIRGITFQLPDTYRTIVLDIRLPRAILGGLIGGSLAISGAALQGLFHNPLVDSGILGVSSSAGFGAALAIICFNNNPLMTYLCSFGFGILAVFLSYTISKIYRQAPTIMLVLGGVIVSAIFSALLSFLKYIADPQDQLPAIVFWLMGSLATANYRDILIAALPMGIGIMGLWAIRWRINVLSMGDKEAKTLGLNTRLNKGIVIICSTLATAGAVCVSGTIGWIGLVIPHIGRMLVGHDNRLLIPASLSLGAFFLILVDNLSRMITGSELPLSILTALIGGPFYVYLLKRTRGGGW